MAQQIPNLSDANLSDVKIDEQVDPIVGESEERAEAVATEDQIDEEALEPVLEPVLEPKETAYVVPDPVTQPPAKKSWGAWLLVLVLGALLIASGFGHAQQMQVNVRQQSMVDALAQALGKAQTELVANQGRMERVRGEVSDLFDRVGALNQLVNEEAALVESTPLE
jgi:hypothetical protein